MEPAVESEAHHAYVARILICRDHCLPYHHYHRIRPRQKLFLLLRHSIIFNEQQSGGLSAADASL